LKKTRKNLQKTLYRLSKKQKKNLNKSAKNPRRKRKKAFSSKIKLFYLNRIYFNEAKTHVKPYFFNKCKNTFFFEGVLYQYFEGNDMNDIIDVRRERKKYNKTDILRVRSKRKKRKIRICERRLFHLYQKKVTF
jgi:hypothetical protein